MAIAPDHATTGEELVQRADVAMYVAKTTHVGVAMYRPDTDRHSPEKLVLLGQLRHAIEADELVLYYQPKNAVPDGSVQRGRGARALDAPRRAAWCHPTTSSPSPSTPRSSSR